MPSLDWIRGAAERFFCPLHLINAPPPLALRAALVLVGCLIVAPVVQGQVTSQVIALVGDAAPDGNGRFKGVGQPVLNDAGQVAFSASLFDSSERFDGGIFRGDGTTLTQIARTGQAAPNGNGSLSPLLSSFKLNGASQVAFSGSLNGTSGGSSDNRGIFGSDGGALIQIAREGQAAPDANGRLSDFFAYTLNDGGQVAFHASLTGTSGGSSDNSGIFRGTGAELDQIVRRGQAVPNANGTINGFNAAEIALNEVGQLAFLASMTNTIGGFNDDTGIFLGTGGALVQIAREGQAAPEYDGDFSSFNNSKLKLNNAGQVAFIGTLTGVSVGTSNDRGIFQGAASSLKQIALIGQAAPDANGALYDFFSLSLNDAGQTAFLASLIGTRNGFFDNKGIFRVTGDALVQIARAGQAAPDGNGSFIEFSTPMLNDAGQVAFVADLTGTGGGPYDDTGLFLFDDRRGLVQLAREGDAFLGSTIFPRAFDDVLEETVFGHERDYLNEQGQVAYHFSLANGRSGIAIASIVPEPAFVSTFLMGLMTVYASSRRYVRLRHSC